MPKSSFKHFPYLCYVSSLEKVKAELGQLKEIQTLNAGLAQTQRPKPSDSELIHRICYVLLNC